VPLPPSLVEFARHHRSQPAPGIEVILTPRYQITLQPDFPIPGPNSISWVRCRPGEADEVIQEARASVAPRHLPVMWIVDPETEPSNFSNYLEARDIRPDPRAPEAEVMVLPIEANVEPPVIAGLEIHDALADLATFRSADGIGAEAFQSSDLGDDPELVATQDRRRVNQLASGYRRVLLATVDGEPAGTAGLSLFPPAGAIITGGAVRPEFRGRGIYRAMVAARLEMARRAGVAGLAVWGAEMSAPILARLGFEKVGWRRFYPDTSTA
jgi:GNAT superfamily N-acetyltransferase